MLIGLYWLLASLFNKDVKILARALFILLVTTVVYSFMYYKAINTSFTSEYYSVNTWTENLIILVTIIEGLGTVLWGYTIYSTLKK